MTFLGIDTSNYTTSLGVCDENGRVLADERIVLNVKAGERGLRQSEAVFQHVKNLPQLFERLKEKGIIGTDIATIGCSITPRPLEDSYMPVFRAGEGFGRSLSAMLGCPIVPVSHQENHIRAAMVGCGKKPEDFSYPLLALHFSGGTSEILKVDRDGLGFSCEILGKTLDLNGGQLVDRIGVHLGLSFPAGRVLEALAEQAKEKTTRLPTSLDGADFHFSGQENKSKALLEAQVPPEEVAYGLFLSVAKTITKSLRVINHKKQYKDVIFSGGVMANQIIAQAVKKNLEPTGLKLHFTKPNLATDNGIGVAFLAMDHYIKTGKQQ